MTAGVGKHPSAEDLLAYGQGQRSTAGADRIRDHLVGCEACARIVLDLAGEMDPADPELVEFWQRLESSFAASEVSAEPARTEGPPAAARPRPVLAIAATLALVAAFVTGTWLGRRGLREKTTGDAGRRPGTMDSRRDVVSAQALFSLDLVPEGYLRNGAGALPTARGANQVLLLGLRMLTLDVDGGDATRIEIRSENGDLVTEIGGLTVSPEGRLEIVAPRRDFPPGSYVVELFGLEDGGTDPIHRYHFAIAP